MKRILTALRQPFPYNYSIKRKLISAVISGFLVAAFLFLFQPFGIGEVKSGLFLITLGYGCVTTFIVTGVSFFQQFFPNIFNEKKWTVGKQILLSAFILFLIGIGNFGFTVIIFKYPVSLKTFIAFQFFTVAVGLFIFSALTMIRYARLLQHYQKGAELIDQTLSQKKLEHTDIITVEENLINLKSLTEKETIEILPSKILYIESADNYSKIVIAEKSGVQVSILRSTLKRIQSDLPDVFFRCHRSFIVNLKNIKHVSGNSQGYRLHFENTSETIPVARTVGKTLHEKLKR